MLLWIMLFPVLLLVTWAQPASLKVRVGTTAVIQESAYVGSQGSAWGPWLHLWIYASSYQQEADAALAAPASRPANTFSAWHLDPSDDPPVRAAYFWFAFHGDVDGFVYDPTGQLREGRHAWLYGSRTWHLFGPWYRCRN